MAIASVGGAGVAGNGTSSTTLDVAPTVTLEAGNLVLCAISVDNTASTDGNHDEVSSVTDTGGNTWSKAHEVTASGGAAAAGVTAALFFSRLTTQLTTGSTVTITFANSVAEKVAFLWEFTVGANVSANATQDDDTHTGNGYGTNTIGSLSSLERLYVMIGGKENNSTSNLTPTTNFNAMTAARSRNNAAAVRIAGEYRINTSTGETSNPTHNINADTASVFVALEEQAGTTVTPTTASLVLTTFAPVLKLGVTPSTQALTLTTFAPSVRVGTVLTPTTASLSLSTFAPTLVFGTVVVPSTLSLTTTQFTPTLASTITPATVALSLTTFAPQLQFSVTPTTATLTITTFVPDIQVGGGGVTVTPTTAALVTTTFAPTVSVTSNQIVTPTTLSLVISTFAPTVTIAVPPRTVGVVVIGSENRIEWIGEDDRMQLANGIRGTILDI